MPDLKSELAKVINSWETDMPTTTPQIGRKITTNSTRITFNYVRDNPGVNRADAIKALTKMGVKESSSTSLITVLLARGNLRLAAGNALFAAQKEYVPLPKVKPKVKKAKPEPVVEAPKAPEPVQIVTTWDAETLLNNLSIKQARALYDELRTIFGG